jgi:8-oxo-dGTP pyrophosphatase MutT (NUDIX family)
MTKIDKVAFISISERSLLCARTRGRTVFYIPGGKREAQESDLDTLVREVKEELNVEIIPTSVWFLGEYEAQADSHPIGVTVRMRCYGAQFVGELKVSAEIEELRWVSYDERNITSVVDQIIFEDVRARRLI